MIVEPTAIPGVLLLTPPRFLDERGFFSETWNERRFTEAGIPGPFVQDNHARSADRGVVRGLHLQIAPSPQGKLMRVVRGSIWDVAVDIRQDSPTYGQHAGVVLSAATGTTLDTGGTAARLLHARAGHGGDLQSHRTMGPTGGTWGDLERSDACHPVAARTGRGAPVRQGPRPAAAGGVRRVAHTVT